jgi:SAM-dependent methyltransferase
LTILDVGCGIEARGDVNCDRFIIDSDRHRSVTCSLESSRLRSAIIPNLVCCDASYLPFKDNVFSLVISNHVIEHVADPLKMLSEMIRVSNHLVKITCPHRFGNGFWVVWNKNGYRWTKKHHVNNMTFTWFIIAAKNLNYDCEVKCSDFYYFPTSFFRLFSIPLEITAKITKRKNKRGENNIWA